MSHKNSGIKINLHQNDEKAKMWRKKGSGHDSKHKGSQVQHCGGCSWLELAWLLLELDY